MKISPVFMWITLMLALPCWVLASETVYMNPAEALEWAFPKEAVIKEDKIDLTREQATAIEAATGAVVYSGDKTIYTGKVNGQVEGYAVITNEIGKFELITFIVKLTPDLKVEKVGIMVYRESRGGEIVRKRFRHQYRGKSSADSFQINKDIINITGATMSVRAINRGVRKVFAIMDFYLK